LGDGGAGWNSTEAGVAGGDGGAGGIFGDGGSGGSGGAGAAGGAGGAGGFVMGIGGDGGAGGAGTAGGAGGAGGVGGAGRGLVFGVGGNGGDGGDGSDGGRGGDGGNGANLLGSGGDGGKGGNSGVGGSPTGLPALGGAGGNAGYLGSHGQVGPYGTGAAATQSSGSLLPISSTGTSLTNSDGQVVLLHGLNEVYKVAPFEPSASGFTADDAAFLAANGFNAVRLGVIWAGVEPQPGVYDTAYINSIQQTVQTLADHGIYTILDFHQDEYSGAYGGEGAPAWASQSGGLPNTSLPFPINEFVDPAENHAWDSFWSNAQAPNGLGLEDDYTQMLETVASNFNGNTDVVGYEIMNEPYPGSQVLPTLLGSPFFDTQELNPFYNQAASAIRAVDPSTAIFYEPNIVTNFGVPTSLGTVDTSNTVFSYHNYLPNYIPIPVIANIVVEEAAAYAKAHDIPAFMTEFGATNSQPSLIASMQPADANLNGWTEWAYSGVGDITTAGDTNSEALVYNPALPPTGDNVNTANLTTLAEPYPRTISGTPNAFSFNNGIFTFSYSTQKADGSGSFPAGAQTDISVPAIVFPNGYQVSVTGGQVVSAPNAPVLVITSNDGASTVNVVVSPAVSSSAQAGLET
jgi:endoglycosylceramidase